MLVWLAWKFLAYPKYSDDKVASALPCMISFVVTNITVDLECGRMWEPEDKRRILGHERATLLFHGSWMYFFYKFGWNFAKLESLNTYIILHTIIVKSKGMLIYS